MSEESSITTGFRAFLKSEGEVEERTTSEEGGHAERLPEKAGTIRWITCEGCGGEVGIPGDWTKDSVECPGCDTRVYISGKVLYCPPSVLNAPTTVASSPPPLVHPVPSVELLRKADLTLIWGLVSIVLGWTVIVPLITLLVYDGTSELAKKERVTTPGKAIVGLVLALLFGIVQGLAVISRLSK